MTTIPDEFISLSIQPLIRAFPALLPIGIFFAHFSISESGVVFAG
jgi:hypothetical protein